MNRSTLSICLALILFLISACGSGGHKERQELRALVNAGQYDKAIEYVEKSAFYAKEDVALLKNLELGLIHNYAGNYYQSAKYLEKAKEIHQKLFTVSIGSAAKTLVMNDNADIYYGQKYERSLIHFYLALDHYLLSQLGVYEGYKQGEKVIAEQKLSRDQARLELMGARAEILAWDSYLEWLKNDRQGESVFKNDLLAKLFGGIIHERMGSGSDLETALQLYKDAKILVFRNYNAYPTFNASAVKFKQDFKKLPKLGEEKVKKDYVRSTVFEDELNDFLDYKILSLTKRLRPSGLKETIRQIGANPKIVEKVQKEGRDQPNVSLIVQDGMIPQKIPVTSYYSLESALTPDNPTETQKKIAQIGSQVIMIFAASQLGLLPPPNNYSPVGMEIGVRVAAVAASGMAIGFELPGMENKPIEKQMAVRVYDEKGGHIKDYHLPVVNPLVDLAREAIAEDSASRYTRIGIRLATKHLTAILASYGTYSLMKNKAGDWLAKSAAVAQYMAAAQGIAATEKADTRYWSTLPSNFRMIDMLLPKGKYSLKLVSYNSKTPDVKVTSDLGTVEVTNPKQKSIFSYRIP